MSRWGVGYEELSDELTVYIRDNTLACESTPVGDTLDNVKGGRFKTD